MARSTADIICVQEAADRMGRNPVTIKKVDTRRNVSGLSARAGGLRDSPRQMFDRYLAGEFRPEGKQEEAA